MGVGMRLRQHVGHGRASERRVSCISEVAAHLRFGNVIFLREMADEQD
jgi:hypothetical protein